MNRIGTLLFASLLACNGGDTDTDLDDDSDTNKPAEGCDELDFHFTGPDDPMVGETWVVFMKCDDVILAGAMTVTARPVELASVDGNEVTFTAEGDVTIKLRGGYGTVEETVNVQ